MSISMPSTALDLQDEFNLIGVEVKKSTISRTGSSNLTSPWHSISKIGHRYSIELPTSPAESWAANYLDDHLANCQVVQTQSIWDDIRQLLTTRQLLSGEWPPQLDRLDNQTGKVVQNFIDALLNTFAADSLSFTCYQDSEEQAPHFMFVAEYTHPTLSQREFMAQRQQFFAKHQLPGMFGAVEFAVTMVRP